MQLVAEAELAAREAALLSAAQEPYAEGARRFSRGLLDLERGLRDDAIELAKRMARAILQRELTVDPGLVAQVAGRALSVLGPVEHVTIACAEADVPLLEAALPQLSQPSAGHSVALTLQPHAELERGGVLLSFDGGLVDARVERQLDRLLDAIRVASLDPDQDDLRAEAAGRPA
jgi:flagellar biosynthesis/type III secretory pathway protein FliH